MTAAAPVDQPPHETSNVEPEASVETTSPHDGVVVHINDPEHMMRDEAQSVALENHAVLNNPGLGLADSGNTVADPLNEGSTIGSQLEVPPPVAPEVTIATPTIPVAPALNEETATTNLVTAGAPEASVPVPTDTSAVEAVAPVPAIEATTGGAAGPLVGMLPPSAAEAVAAPKPNQETPTTAATTQAAPPQEENGAIWEPAEYDVLSGRGASVNSHTGNKKFRALCFSRKPLFDAGNHAAKRRIATEIVTSTLESYKSRFLRKKQDKGPWFEMTREQAILKASQVIRDYKRPDRLAQRELMAASGKKRNRPVSTPMDDVVIPPVPAGIIVENPFGINNSDVLCGRGAFVNGHAGNKLLRSLATERKPRFDAGNYTEKRSLASEIVAHIKHLDPPGRFLKRPKKSSGDDEAKAMAVPPTGDDIGWIELGEEDSIHKACQVMRDIARADRRERDERRRLKKLKKEGRLPPEAEAQHQLQQQQSTLTKEAQEASDSIALLAQSTTGSSTSQVVDEAVAAAEAAMDKALEMAQPPSVNDDAEEAPNKLYESSAVV